MAWHERVSINSICFPERKLDEQASYWQQLGTQRVGMVGFQIATEGVSAAQDALIKSGCTLETIVHPFVPFAPLNPAPDSWDVPRVQLNQEIDTAAQLGSNSIYMLTGGHGDLTWEQAADTFSAALEPCIQPARDAGIQLLVENATMQNADLHIAHSLRDAITLAEQSDIGVCIDIFACWTEAGLKTSIERAVPRCHLVQVSDYVYGDRSPMGRAVPGDGNIPLERIIDWILSAGYRGAFDLELIGPRIDDEGHLDAARRAGDKLSELLTALGA